jgi:hypothetical protein
MIAILKELKQMWFSCYLKLFFFIIIIVFSQNVLADNNNCINDSFDSLNFKKLEKIEINTIENRKLQLNNLNILIDARKSILPKFKKKYLSKILVFYSNGDQCELKGFVRQNGDLRDHIRFANGKIYQSLDVSLINGNINGIVKFKLLLNDTRGTKEDEIIITELLREVGFISPRTSLVDTEINGAKSEMIFQEKSVKELLEFNLRREGPILEGNEEFVFKFQSEILRDGTAQYKETYEAMVRGTGLQLARLSNSNWSMRSLNHFDISVKALSKLNQVYLTFLSNYKNEVNNFDFQEYGLSNKMLGASDENNIKKLNHFNILLHAAGADHALLPRNRKFYWNNVMNFFEPIYYDGSLDFNKAIINQAFSENMWLPYHGNILEDHNSLIDQISNIDLNNLYKKLKIKNLEIDKLILEKKIKILINNIKKSYKNLEKTDKELINFNKNIAFDQTYKDSFIKNLNTNNLNSKFVKLLDKDRDTIILESCDVITSICEKRDYNFYNIDDISELRSILESTLKDKKYFYEIDPFIKINEPTIKILKVQNTDLVYSDDIDINYDKENDVLNIFQKKEGSRIFFKNGSLKNININFISNHSDGKLVDFPIDNFGNTGCITFIGIEFINVRLSSKNSNCEDAINIINSRGKIKYIDIKDSISDGLDMDFSQISIDKVFISNSKNDCADFSMGKYNINEIITEYCGDKSISIGENSIFIAKKVYSKFSDIGLATKDSSYSAVDFIDIQKTKYCIAAYNKKQEFTGGKIEVNQIDCTDYSEEKFLDNISIYKAQNKNLKTLIEKNEKEVIVNTPIQYD